MNQRLFTLPYSTALLLSKEIPKSDDRINSDTHNPEPKTWYFYLFELWFLPSKPKIIRSIDL